MKTDDLPALFCSDNDAVRRWTCERQITGEIGQPTVVTGGWTHQCPLAALAREPPGDARGAEHLGLHERQAAKVKLRQHRVRTRSQAAGDSTSPHVPAPMRRW